MSLGYQRKRVFAYRVQIAAIAICASLFAVVPASAQTRAPHLAFEEHAGPSGPTFVSRTKGYVLGLDADEAVLAIRDTESAAAVRLRLAGATKRTPDGLEALPGKIYYVAGSDPTLVPNRTFRRVRYAKVYPGIDAVYYGDDGRLEFDFIVAPHADPSQIALTFSGASRIQISDAGDLALRIGAREVLVKKPFIYQDIDGARQEVDGRFVLDAQSVVRFDVGSYDTSRALVLDPVVVFASYLGSVEDERVVAVRTDAQSSIYVFGRTFDTASFPASQSFGVATLTRPKCFVSKFDASGSQLIYSAIFADSFDIAGDAMCDALSVTPDGRVGVLYTGNTLGTFTKTARVVGEQNGNLQSLATVRAVHLEGQLPARGIALDSSNDIYVVGSCFNSRTQTPPPVFTGGFRLQPATPGHCVSPDNLFGTGPSESVLAKYSSGGLTIYATYIGGTSDDESTALALTVDDAGIAFVAGQTKSTDFPTRPNAFQQACDASTGVCHDGFLLRIDTTQSNQVPGEDSLVYSSYLGGAGPEFATTIYVAPTGLVSVAGSTSSTGFSTQSSVANPSTFVALLDLSADPEVQLQRLTLLPHGGDLPPYADQFAFLPDGSFAIAGLDFSAALPLVNQLPVPPASGTDQPFLVAFAPDGLTLRTATYLVSANTGPPRIAPSGTGGIVAAMDTATTGLAIPGAYQDAIAGGTDVLVMHVDLAEAPVNQPPFVTIYGPTTVFADGADGGVVLSAGTFDPENDPLTFAWSGPFTNNPVTTEAVLAARLPLGQQTVSVVVQDPHGNSTTASLVIDVVANTSTGSSQTVTPPDRSWSNAGINNEFPVTLTFEDVTTTGGTSLTTRYVFPPVPPPGMQFGSPPLYYDLATTAGYSGDIEACIDYRGNSFARPDADVRIYRQTNGVWTPVPQVNDPAARKVCATTPALGTFALFTPAVAANEISLFAGQAGRPTTCSADPNEGVPATASALCSPRGMTYDGARGVVYYAEGIDKVRRVDLATGNVTTVAGNGFRINAFPNGDPRDDDRNDVDPLTVPMSDPLAVALDVNGNLYLAEYGANRIRRIDLASNRILTVAGGGGACPFPANPQHPLCAAMERPSSVVVDSAGAVLFVEFLVDAPRIRRITPGADGIVNGSADETIQDVAGNGSPYFDANAVPAQGVDALSVPIPASALAFGLDGSLYATGSGGMPFLVRITPGADGLIDGASDTVFTVVGNPPANPLFTGDGLSVTQARLFYPWALAVAPNGDIYVGDGGHYQAATVRRIDAVDGIVTGAADETITSVAGYHVFDPQVSTPNELPYSDGDGHALSSVFGSAWGLALLPNGDLLISDTHQIRRIGTRTSTGTDADLAVSASATPTTTYIGGSVDYSVTVRNNGPATATGVTLTLPVPSETTIVTASTPVSVSCAVVATALTCDLGTVASGQQVPIVLSATALSAGSPSAVFSVSGLETDPQTANNTATVVVDVEPTADMSVAIVSPTPGATVDLSASFAIDVLLTNIGPSTASTTRLNVPLPAALEFVSGTLPGGRCDFLSGVVTCDLDGVAAGASAHAVLTVRARTPGAIAISADVSASMFDPVQQNNTATLSFTLTALPVVINVSEAIRVTDTITPLPSVLLAVNETINVTDTIVPTPSILLAVDERITVTDGIDPQVQGTGNVSMVLSPLTATLPAGSADSILALISDATTEASRVVLVQRGRTVRAAFLNPGAPNSPLSIFATGSAAAGGDVVVVLSTNASGALTSTAAQVVAALGASPSAADMVIARLWPGSTGTGIVQPRPLTSLTEVRFVITGPNTATTSCTTNEPGYCGFSYVGANVGTDVITAFTDRNSNGVFDAGELFATATKTWTDAPPPALSLPGNLAVPATSAAGAAVSYVATATDAVSGSRPVTCSPVSGATFPVGTTTVSCSASDAAGNTTTGSFTVTVAVGTPALSVTVASTGRDATGYWMDLRLTNTGTGHARGVVLSSVVLRTLTGTGNVTYDAARSGPLPLAIGDVNSASTRAIRIYLNVPLTVRRFSITETGTMRNVLGTSSSFSFGQAVIP